MKENGEQEVGACHAGKDQPCKGTERLEGHLDFAVRFLGVLNGKIEAHRAEGQREEGKNTEDNKKNGVGQAGPGRLVVE